MRKAPAFQLYTNDWLSSTKITLMKPEQEGAYIRLLCYAWNEPDCGLPDDDEQLAVLSRLGEGWLKGGSSVVRKCFFEKDGRLYNKRLLEERKKQEVWRKKSSEGGKLSANIRRKRKIDSVKGGSTTVPTKRQPKGQPKGNSSSSFSSSKTNTKKKEIKERKKFLSDSFDIFWKAYPGTKTDKKKCFEKWKKINPDEKLFDEILKALQEQKAWRARARPDEFRPEWKNPLTWLNRECWEDEIIMKGKPQPEYPKIVTCNFCEEKYRLMSRAGACDKCKEPFWGLRTSDGTWKERYPGSDNEEIKALTAKTADSMGGKK